MRYAQIKDGVVINTIELDDPAVILAELIEPSERAEIGWVYDGETFFPPTPTPDPVPESVSMRQARLSLLGAGMLLSVNAAIAAMPGVEGEAARIEWEYATEVRRDSPLVSGLSGALNLSAEQLDTLFVQAAGL